MIMLQAILLGIIEGLTEFLPISSTGHLVVAEQAIGYKDAAEIFTVVIQIGAIAAVLWHYRRDLFERCRGLLQGGRGALTFWRNWIIATIPAGIAGLVLESKLSEVPLAAIAASLIIGGLLIWLIEELHRSKLAPRQVRLEQISVKQSLQIGLYQILALVPGVSRSGATIMGGLLSGLDRVTATAFSFYLSLPILILAGGLKLMKHHDMVGQITGGSAALIMATVAAFITALAAITWLLKYVAHHNFKPFAYYRIILGILILTVLWWR
jgi:undecaprenyl-diphosphatase